MMELLTHFVKVGIYATVFMSICLIVLMMFTGFDDEDWWSW